MESPYLVTFLLREKSQASLWTGVRTGAVTGAAPRLACERFRRLNPSHGIAFTSEHFNLKDDSVAHLINFILCNYFI